jgi:hypothetical protein
VSETSVRELEKQGLIKRHLLYGLTLEVFYKEELDDYLDNSLLRNQLTVVSSNNEKQTSEGRGIGIPKGKRNMGGKADREWPANLTYSGDEKRGGRKTPRATNR